MNKEEQLNLTVAPTLFIEFHGATKGQLSEALDMSQEICRVGDCLEFRPGLDRSEKDRIFRARHGLGEMIIRNHPDCRVLCMDVAVPITKYPELVETIRKKVAQANIVGYTLSHAGDGNVHLVMAGKKGDRKDFSMMIQSVQQPNRFGI
jgi:D-lactate dehydrogenase (cytochrome)